MNFYDTVAEQNYVVVQNSKEKEIIDICKADDSERHLCEIHIIFYLKEKKIMGYILPLDVFYDIDDMTKIYAFYRIMVEDIKIFANKSKYEIVE